MIAFEDVPLAGIFVGSFLALLMASEAGRFCGAARRAKGGDSVATLEGAVLGLLALMISFTFAMALSRFDARRDAVLNEANAIGTTALRARLLPTPHSTDSLNLLREYTQMRLDITQAIPTVQERAAFLERSISIQEALWQQAKAVAAKDNAMVPAGIFIQTLNEMIDSHEKRLTALRNRVPTSVLLTLYSIAVVAVGFSGYASGLDAHRSRPPIYLMCLLVAGVILLIQDLDRPSTGFVKVSQQPMIDTASGLASYK